MHFVDHVFVLLLFVVQPIYGALAYPRFLRKIEAGESVSRTKLYRHTFVQQWSALTVLGIVWYVLSRPAADLGLIAPGGTGFYVGTIINVLAGAFLVQSWRNARQMTVEQKTKHAAALGHLAHVLPRSLRQYRHFFGLSVTAGIAEEIVYRGFVIWYLAQVMPLWAAVIVSSVVFGLGHSYQGTSGAIRTGVAGLVFAVLYVFTGSIWLPIIGHALVDILQGKMVYEILRDAPQGEPVAESPSRACC